MHKILLVEDEEDLATAIAFHLKQQGFDVQTVHSGLTAKSLLKKSEFDLILLDWMLPELSGIKLVQWLREKSSSPDTLVLMVTAKGELASRIKGLEKGANDYMVKPFSLQELTCRVRQMLNLYDAAKNLKTIHRVGELQIFLPQRKIWKNGNSVELSVKEFSLLQVLLNNRGRCLSREDILSAVWTDELSITERTVDTYIKRLRQKIDREGVHIQSVHGLGYIFQDERNL